MATKATLTTGKVQEVFKEFSAELVPFEATHEPPALHVFQDNRTGAYYCECHLLGSKLVEFATTDVPLDPDEQSEYRANRELVTNAPAFARMEEDAKKRRSFSNIVAEYTKDFDATHPVKIIGGQHRFAAIKVALNEGVDEHHGVKVYLGLTMEQRLDVQLISNTNIAISIDLFDRMQETYKGPELRNWCQKVGFLQASEDFSDRRVRGGTITVQVARTFISNYLAGRSIDAKKFDMTDTTPLLSPTGEHDDGWDDIRDKTANWSDPGLIKAAEEFSKLVEAQRAAFSGKKPKAAVDFPEKATNGAVLSAWAYVAGLLEKNTTRLNRHFGLRGTTAHDPLNAAALAKGRHKTDPDNYRGLGYRTDAKERGRLVELFYLQAEGGKGITGNTIDVAIKKYHAKQAQLEVMKAEQKGD
jgi:hypothetical protein